MNFVKRYLIRNSVYRFQEKLSSALATDYGLSDFYTAEQVNATIDRNSINRKNDIYAFAMFCEKDVFATYANKNSLTEEYDLLRATIGDLLFNSRSDYKQTEVSTPRTSRSRHIRDHGGEGADVGD